MPRLVPMCSGILWYIMYVLLSVTIMHVFLLWCYNSSCYINSVSSASWDNIALLVLHPYLLCLYLLKKFLPLLHRL